MEEEENEYQLDRENDYLTPIHQLTIRDNGDDPFVADMARAQLEMGAAQIDSTNPNFGSRYASLPSVARVAKIINKYGFMITHDVHQETTHLMVETIVSHISGKERSTQIKIPLSEYTTKDGKVKKVDAHMIGSAITYGRRYGLAAILGIPADEDDDGNLAAIGLTPAQSGPAQTQRPAQKPQNQNKPPTKQQSLPRPKYSSDELKQMYLSGVHPEKKEICVEIKKKHGDNLNAWPVHVLEIFLEEIKLNDADLAIRREILDELTREDESMPANQRMMINRIQSALKSKSIEFDDDKLGDYLAFLSRKSPNHEIDINQIFKDVYASWQEFIHADEPSFKTATELANWALDSHWIRTTPKLRAQIIKKAETHFKAADPAVVNYVIQLLEISLSTLPWEEICRVIALTMGYPQTGHTNISLPFHLEKLSGGKSLKTIRAHMVEALKLCATEVNNAAASSTTGKE